MRDWWWGHNLFFHAQQEDGSWKAHIIVQDRVENGDLVLAQSKSGETLTYEAFNVEWCRDPEDMYSLCLRYVSGYI